MRREEEEKKGNDGGVGIDNEGVVVGWDPACSFKKECLVWIPTHKRADSAGNEPILLLWAICIRPN